MGVSSLSEKESKEREILTIPDFSGNKQYGFKLLTTLDLWQNFNQEVINSFKETMLRFLVKRKFEILFYNFSVYNI